MLETTNISDEYGNPAVAEIRDYVSLIPAALIGADKFIKKAVEEARPEPDARGYGYWVADKAIRLMATVRGGYEVRLRNVEFTYTKFEGCGPDVVVNKGTAFENSATRGTLKTWKAKFCGGNRQFSPHGRNKFAVEVGEPVVEEGIFTADGFTAHPADKPAVVSCGLPKVGEVKEV